MPSPSSHGTAQAGTCPKIPPLLLLSQQEWEEPNIKAPRYIELWGKQIDGGPEQAQKGREGTSQASFVSLISMGGWMVSPHCLVHIVYFFQLQGMSQHLPPPLLPIYFFSSSLEQPH